MTEETETQTEDKPPEKTEEQTVPYDRFSQVNQKAKAEAEARKAAEKQIADLKAQMEERESAGLPELERLKKEMEKASRRAEEAERRAEESDKAVARGKRERWVTSAAAAQNFADPSDAAMFLNLDDIEDEKDAERAVKRLAAQKKHLLKADEPKLPGRVLSNGAQVPQGAGRQTTEMERQLAEAQMLTDGLKQFIGKQ